MSSNGIIWNSEGFKKAVLEGLTESDEIIKWAESAFNAKDLDGALLVLQYLEKIHPTHTSLPSLKQQVNNFKSMMYVQVPQITEDSIFGKAIYECIKQFYPEVILDLGAATGLGSTAIMAQSVKDFNLNSRIYALETQEETFFTLKKNVEKFSFVVPIQACMLNEIETLPQWSEIYNDILLRVPNFLNQYPVYEVESWYQHTYKEMQTMITKGQLGSRFIGENLYDMVLLDADEFFAKEQLKSVIDKSNILLLDDVCSYKNAANHSQLTKDPLWKLWNSNLADRNGWSIFIRRDFLQHSVDNRINSSTKVFVTSDRQLFFGEDAERLLNQKNDKKYISKEGVVKVDQERWKEAQQFEYDSWMQGGLHLSDDRNADHLKNFNSYQILKKDSYPSVLEMGCGPFTNLRLILPQLKGVNRVTLLDPLIDSYLNHPHCTYSDGNLSGLPVKMINSPIEDFNPTEQFDLVVLNNVLEHCFDIKVIFDKIIACLKPGGKFVFAENVLSDSDLMKVLSNQYDEGHPIRCSEKFVDEFLLENFLPLYHQKFYGFYDQTHRIDNYFIGERIGKRVGQVSDQAIDKIILTNSRTIHFVYSGNPEDDHILSAPGTITNHLFRYLEGKGNVKYYDYAEKLNDVEVSNNDIVIGHPHPDAGTALRVLFEKHCAGKFIIWPFHHRIPEINHYMLDISEKADRLFPISGPYWLKNMENTVYGPLENKMIRVDNAIDLRKFPFRKTNINPKGNRGYFILSRSGPEKGSRELFTLLNKIEATVWVAGYYRPEDLALLKGRPNTNIISHFSWADENLVNQVANECDYFLNFSISDASPTTLFETMALGLLPITTPQCGYTYPGTMLLSLNDSEHNYHIFNQVQNLSEDVIKTLQQQNLEVLKKNHTWEGFTNTVWQGISQVMDSKCEANNQSDLQDSNRLIPSVKKTNTNPTLAVDGVIFQLQADNEGGISRVWKQILQKLPTFMPEWNFVYLQRERMEWSPKGWSVHKIPTYLHTNREDWDSDDKMLSETCNTLNVSCFMSTYYSRAMGVINCQMVYDLIPEVFGFDMTQGIWATKVRAFNSAQSFISISKSTQRDLQNFYGHSKDIVSVAYPGLSDCFKPVSLNEINLFKQKYHIQGPYFLMVGNREIYKNGFKALEGYRPFFEKTNMPLITIGGEKHLIHGELESDGRFVKRLGYLTDEELAAAYSGAKALLYPSVYEGFGIPIVEALSCQCPVASFKISSIPEASGDYCYYIKSNTPEAITEALFQLTDHPPTNLYREQAQKFVEKFTWQEMAKSVATHLIKLIPIKEKVGDAILKADYWNKEGESFFTSEDYNSAKKCFQKAIEFDSNHVLSLNNLGVCLWREGLAKESLEELTKALTIDSTNLSVILNICEILVELGYDKGAINILEELSPEMLENKELKGLYLQLKKKVNPPYNKGLEKSPSAKLEKELEVDPLNPDLLKQLCNYYTPRDNFFKLQFFFSAALDLEPDNNLIREMYVKIEKQYLQHLIKLSHLENSSDPASNLKVSVIVSTYNSQEFIPQCLEDINNQTWAKQIEVIVIDAASVEDEANVVKEYQSKMKNLVYLRTTERIGIYTAWNLGAYLANSPLILPFSTNDRLKPDTIESLAAALNENPDVGIAYGNTLLTSKPHQSFENYERSPHGDSSNWTDYNWENLVCYCSVGPNPMWRKELHDKIGYFDDRYKAIGDQDFFNRVAIYKPLLYIDKTTGLQWMTENSLSGNTNTDYEEFEIKIKHQDCYQRITGNPLPDQVRKIYFEKFKSAMAFLVEQNETDTCLKFYHKHKHRYTREIEFPKIRELMEKLNSTQSVIFQKAQTK